MKITLLKKFRLSAGVSTIALLNASLLLSGATAQQATSVDQEEDVVVVTGRRMSSAAEAVGEGEAGNTVSVTREALLSAPSGVSGLKALEGLPGFNVQTDGALGLYEFGNSVIHHFSIRRILNSHGAGFSFPYASGILIIGICIKYMFTG
ncbi:MAG: hypothetical protein HOJ34_06415 [Kordiimonadaceae bacterium]|jgi:hypothetical protein|nr:hypothetical protein [Kordiimonadaceae bacterium]MBT6036349.1 hypothetical protein [Kordiimonadaceae bacterium]MBT6329399.1 hypothetical protein [Kordiimonadaceae bacterium]MBT7581824.1 hypothetical protein [Kordiimonadaceae bacterium]